MKSVAALVLFVAAGLAQDMGSLSECGQMCVNNMLDLAPSLGCERTDVACLCENMDFGYGVRDCATEACPDDDLDSITSTARGMCSDDGSDGGSTTGGSGPDETGTGTNTDEPTGTMKTTVMTSKSMPGPTGSMTGSMAETSGGGSETDSASPTSTSDDDSGSGSGSGTATGSGATTGSEGVAARTAVPGIAGALGVIAVLAA